MAVIIIQDMEQLQETPLRTTPAFKLEDMTEITTANTMRIRTSGLEPIFVTFNPHINAVMTKLANLQRKAPAVFEYKPIIRSSGADLKGRKCLSRSTITRDSCLGPVHPALSRRHGSCRDIDTSLFCRTPVDEKSLVMKMIFDSPVDPERAGKTETKWKGHRFSSFERN